tara:strand:- start:860 stop:1792 length:933 start_codon:yes stop_codon:yes gene_type:complete
MNLKKPKFWDYKKPNVFAYLLYPLTILFKIITLFSKNVTPQKFKIKTICVGNIYLGGTGKTSLSIKINNILFKNKIKSCFIKKYYLDQIDEQKILKNNGKLFLSSKRTEAIKQAEIENYEVAIIDDGLQDNSIDYDIKLLCFNNINWIGNGMTLPSGPLRENINNLKYYDDVFLNGNLENIEIIKKYILKINPKVRIHLGIYIPTNLNELKRENNYFIFSGIGNHQTFISMLKHNGVNILKDIEFPDHYLYSRNDIEKILVEAKNLKCEILTTEKDYIRLDKNYSNQIKYIKSDLKIIDEENFIKSVLLK